MISRIVRSGPAHGGGVGAAAQWREARAAGEGGAPAAGRGARGGGAQSGGRQRLRLGLLVLAAAVRARSPGGAPEEEQVPTAGRGRPGARRVGTSGPAEAAAEAGEVAAPLPAARGAARGPGGDPAARAGPHAGRQLETSVPASSAHAPVSGRLGFVNEGEK